MRVSLAQLTTLEIELLDGQIRRNIPDSVVAAAFGIPLGLVLARRELDVRQNHRDGGRKAHDGDTQYTRGKPAIHRDPVEITERKNREESEKMWAGVMESHHPFIDSSSAAKPEPRARLFLGFGESWRSPLADL